MDRPSNMEKYRSFGILIKESMESDIPVLVSDVSSASGPVSPVIMRLLTTSPHAATLPHAASY